jgi:hypothetical protein
MLVMLTAVPVAPVMMKRKLLDITICNPREIRIEGGRFFSWYTNYQSPTYRGNQ